MTIADRIIMLRKSRELSQEELAERAGISRQAGSKWESEQSVPDMYNIVMLSEIFGVTTDYLLKGVEPLDERPERRNKPAMAYNIVATALNVLGYIISFVMGLEEDALLGTMTGFVFIVLGIMVFMLGTTRISRRDQLANACRFWRVNLWILAFFVFSIIYNAALGSAPASFPTYSSYQGFENHKWVLYVNGEAADEARLHFVRNVAPAIFTVVYMVFCAAGTYLLTMLELRYKTGEPTDKPRKKEVE